MIEIDPKEMALWDKGEIPRKRLINRFNKYYTESYQKTVLSLFGGRGVLMDPRFAILTFKKLEILEENKFFDTEYTQEPYLYTKNFFFEVWLHIQENGQYLRFVDKAQGGYGYHVFIDFKIEAILDFRAEKSAEMVMMDLLHNIKKHNEQNTKTDRVLGTMLRCFQKGEKKEFRALWSSP